MHHNVLAQSSKHYRGLRKMHQSLLNIQQQLEKVIAALRAAIPSDEPFGNAQGNWGFPGLTRVDDRRCTIVNRPNRDRRRG
jgi:hypothetical protein